MSMISLIRLEDDAPWDWNEAADAAQVGDWDRFTRAAEAWDVFSKGALVLVPGELPMIRAMLAERRLCLLDGVETWSVYPAAQCISCDNCGEPHDKAFPCSMCTTDDTQEQCLACGKTVAGPPVYCCDGRRQLVEKLKTPTPIRRCETCHGIGVTQPGLRCGACRGTGVAS